MSAGILLLLLTASPSNQTSGAVVWTDRGCGAVYNAYDPVTVYFVTYYGMEYELWSFHTGKSPKLLSAGMGDGHTYYITGTVGPPAGTLTFVLSMPCTEGCAYCGMCDYGECTVYVQEYICDCPNQCFGDDLYAMTCVNGVCVKDYIIEKNSAQCGYDPCRNVACGTVCKGFDLWIQKCVNGSCVDDRLLEANSISCGYDPCTNIVCRDVCDGFDLWSQKCVNGACEKDQLKEANSVTCGFDPCQDHCNNGKQDCGEYGVDCGGGCPFIDSDSDGVEDCLDLCPNSRCNKVDVNGCETDIDADGVMDCEDDCPNEKGDASNRGCPTMNLILILGGIGGVIAVGGGLALWGLKGGIGGGKPPAPKMAKAAKQISKPPASDLAARKEAAEKIAEQMAKEAARKKAGAQIGEEAAKKVGAKMAEAGTKEAGMKMAEAATKDAGTKIAEAATKDAGTKIAEAATKDAGTKIAEAATKDAGTKIAEAATKDAGTKIGEAGAGAGVAGVVSKKLKEEITCPECGEKLPADSKFCGKCGHRI